MTFSTLQVSRPNIAACCLQRAQQRFRSLRCGPMISTPSAVFQIHRAAGMVDVTVGQPYRLQRNAVFLDGLQDHIDIATGIDNHAFLRVGIEQNRAILLEMGNRDNARL